MKYLYIILMGLLMFATAGYAEGTGHTGQKSEVLQDGITVIGQIVDEVGDPLPGATVQQKGTTNGTITNLEGEFTIVVPSEAVLTVSFIGYQSSELAVQGRSNIGKVTLALDLTELDEVVVVGYGVQRKVDLTGSVAIVDTDEMKKISNSNISTMLQGRVAGVQITSDGQPGADPAVRIRGLGTFGNSNPLYIVDGVIIGTTIRDFSPNDIESLQVLKDAAASAVYGARAANGVVIITTKSGRKNQPLKIDYSGYVGVDEVQEGIYDVMDAAQYGEYMRMSHENYGIDVPSGYDPNSPNYLDPNEVNTDWFDEAFKLGVRQNHNINLSGGSENSTYNVALDYFKQEGTIEGAGPNLERYTGRIKNTMDVKFLKFTTNLVWSHSDQDNMAVSNANEFVQGLYGSNPPVMITALTTPPSIKAYDESTWFLDDVLGPASQYNYDSYGYGTYYDDIHGDLRVTNVLLINNLLKRNTKVDRILGSGTMNVDLLKMVGVDNVKHKFNYNLNVSYNRTFVKGFTFIPSFIQSTTNYLAKTDERLTKDVRDFSTGLLENTLTYDGNFGKHHINVLAGYTFQRDRESFLTGSGVNLTEPYILQVQASGETTSESYDYEAVLESYLGRINYEYDDKYLLSATLRQDGSSRLSYLDNKDIFPAASVGWRIDRESFFPVNKSLVNLLKIRGSYGSLGNIANMGYYDYVSSMEIGDYSYSFDNQKVTGSSVSNFAFERIRWERKTTIDVGLDLGLFENKLEFNFDYYKTESEDVHYTVPVPLTSGYTNVDVKMNAASMVNSGLEFAIAYHNDDNAVKYDISANLTTLKNEVTKLGVLNDPRQDGIARTEVGHEVGRFYGYVYEGIFQTQEEIDNRVNSEGGLVTQDGAQPGDVAYADINNDGTITAEDQTYIGSGIPDFTFGLNARVEWKGLDLSIMTFGAAGFDAVDEVYNVLHSSYGTGNKSVDLLNAWTPDNTNTDVPRVAYRADGSVNNDFFSSRQLQNGTYLKIGSIQLGYNCPDKWFGDYVNSVRFYATAQNVHTFTKYKGYNADFAGATFTPGYNYASYPTPRTIMIGAQFSF